MLLVPLAACASGEDDSPGVASNVTLHDEDGMHGAVLDDPYRLPGGTLTDTAGDPFVLQDRLGEADLTLVFFGYTHCPDICQAVMADVASAFTRLDEDRAERTAMWFVTTDPTRDDPETLRAYLDRFDPSFEGLTGPLDDIVAVAEGVKVAIEDGPKLPSGGYEITHGTHVVGVRSDGSVPILWTEGTSAAKLAEDIEAAFATGLTDPQEG